MGEKTNSNCKVIFLEGPIQTGKSTLIRSLTEKLITDGDADGFTSQRLINENGKTIAFRIGAAKDPIAVAYSQAQKIQSMKGVFKYTDEEGRMHVKKDFFNTEGVEILTNLRKKAESGQLKLLLLDEIGGHELASDNFRKELERLLACGVPCIGVIKSADNMARMLSKDPEKGKKLLQLNENLHNFITTEALGEIYYFDRIKEPETVEKAGEAIKKVVQNVQETLIK